MHYYIIYTIQDEITLSRLTFKTVYIIIYSVQVTGTGTNEQRLTEDITIHSFEELAYTYTYSTFILVTLTNLLTLMLRQEKYKSTSLID